MTGGALSPILLLLCPPQPLTRPYHAPYSAGLVLFKGGCLSIGLWAPQQGLLLGPYSLIQQLSYAV